MADKPKQPLTRNEVAHKQLVRLLAAKDKAKKKKPEEKPRDLEPRGNTDLPRYARKLKGEP